MSRALCLLALLCLVGCSRESREAYVEFRREKTAELCYSGPETGEIIARIPTEGGGHLRLKSKDVTRCPP